jgi:hypothetical protein
MVFQQLQAEAVATTPKSQKQQFLDELPQEFSRKDYLAAAHKLAFPTRPSKSI